MQTARAFYPEIASTPKTGYAALIIFSYQLKKKERLILCARKPKVKLQGIAPHPIGRKTSLLKKLYLGIIPRVCKFRSSLLHRAPS